MTPNDESAQDSWRTERKKAAMSGPGLKKVRMEGFRGIGHGTVDGLADVTILVGRNNSGKSTVLEAVSRTLASLQAIDVVGRHVGLVWQQIRNDREGIPKELWYGGHQDKIFKVVLSFPRFELVLEGAKGALSVKAGSPRRKVGATTSVTFWPSDARNRDIEGRLWPEVIRKRKDKTILGVLSNVFGSPIEQLQMLPDGRLYVLSPAMGLPCDVYGDGFRLALRALIMLVSIQDALFLIEEPETHQHPGSLGRFAEAVCGLAREQRVQVIATTQSIESVRAYRKAAKASGREFAAFHLSLSEGGHLTSRRLDAETFDRLDATGLDIRELDLYG